MNWEKMGCKYVVTGVGAGAPDPCNTKSISSGFMITDLQINGCAVTVGGGSVAAENTINSRTFVNGIPVESKDKIRNAAPALLEALEGLYQMVQENYHVDENNMKFIDKAYAAIAAARGE